MAVTWFVFPERPRAELLLIDPYTFTEFEDAMLDILDAPALPGTFEFSSTAGAPLARPAASSAAW